MQMVVFDPIPERRETPASPWSTTYLVQGWSGAPEMASEAAAVVRPLQLPSVAWKVIVAGLLIRESFSFWTGEPYDLDVWIRTGYVVAHGTNPYLAFWPAVPGVSVGFLNQLLPSASYLAFWPALLGGLYRTWESVGGGNRFALYLLIKQPPILGDTATAYLLFQLVRRWTGSERSALAALSYWSFFPYAIVITAVWGQFDSIVVAILLALMWVRESWQRNLLNGLGIFVKWLTVIFLPLEVFRERGVRRLGVLIALGVPLGLTLAAFVGFGWGFQGIQATTGSQAHGGGGGENLAFALSFQQVPSVLGAIPYFYTAVVYLWVPAVIVGGWVAARWLAPADREAELRAMLLITSLFLVTRWGLYEQYMLYIFSLLILDIFVFHPERRPLFLFVLALASVDLIVNNTLGIWFLSPVNPGFGTFVQSVDSAPIIGAIRAYALLGLSLLMTVTLCQLVYVFLHDDPRPRPWFGRFLRAPGPAPPSDVGGSTPGP